jgi:hypothetical protein
MSQTNAHATQQPTPVYEDLDRPNGVPRADIQAPGWFQDSIAQATRTVVESIMGLIHHNQHEYLDKRRLPNAIKATDALVKPHMLPDGSVVVMTVFPVAAEGCFVAWFTPHFDGGFNAMSGQPTPSEEEQSVTTYTVQVYREGLSAVHNVPQLPSNFIVDELCRQAQAIKLRQVQFLYFTIMKPNSVQGFDDPHDYVAKLTAQANDLVQQRVAEMDQAIAKSAGPTPLD